MASTAQLMVGALGPGGSLEGQPSIRINIQWRAFYRIVAEKAEKRDEGNKTIEIVQVENINAHDDKK
ncbi:MAG: hypothetical protein EOO40_01625 [Deltaproteobacteria bacterium]|nr:MAG: hypothetical protein EOO40_01625 [Deltaproteobacteria bacterium]